MFGDVNLVMLGDFWQLQLVSGIYLASDFTAVSAGRAQKALHLFWGDDADSIHSFWQLTELMRCKDTWYNSFLTECRNGNLSKEKYCYIHGLPTLASPCTECCFNNDAIIDPVLGKVKASWRDAFVIGCANMQHLIENEESNCAQCSRERKRRERVLTNLHTIPEELRNPPYSSATAL